MPAPVDNPLVVALDTSSLEEAVALAERLEGAAGLLKIGLELFTSEGPRSVATVERLAPVFLDLKLHDIPATVARAAGNAAALGVRMLTVHALGGEKMVAAAVEAVSERAPEDPPMVVAVTVLSSVGGESFASPASLAFEAVSAGAGGVVVSGDDVREVRDAVGDAVTLVVPGVRPAGAAGNDHVRVLTPGEAIESGADYLVVGRPVTRSENPAAAARAILGEIGR